MNKEELLPYLKNLVKDQENADPRLEMLRSKVDGEEFVIRYGGWITGEMNLHLRPKFRCWRMKKWARTAKRHVLQYRYVKEVTDEIFQTLPFPKGFGAP